MGEPSRKNTQKKHGEHQDTAARQPGGSRNIHVHADEDGELGPGRAPRRYAEVRPYNSTSVYRAGSTLRMFEPKLRPTLDRGRGYTCQPGALCGGSHLACESLGRLLVQSHGTGARWPQAPLLPTSARRGGGEWAGAGLRGRRRGRPAPAMRHGALLPRAPAPAGLPGRSLERAGAALSHTVEGADPGSHPPLLGE